VSETATPPHRLRRHQLLWTSRAWHADALGQVADNGLRERVADLLAADWPLVVRRQSWAENDASTMAESVAGGLPLPPALGKQRIAFDVPHHAIVRTAPPLALSDVIPRLPPDWQPPLRRLLRSAESIGVEFRVYGSVAWHALTGRPWLTPESDIDLLWRAGDSAQLTAVITSLEAWEGESGRRADGEILFGDDDAVAWREWGSAPGRAPAQRVLVKSLHSARLRARGELEARLLPEPSGAAACA